MGRRRITGRFLAIAALAGLLTGCGEDDVSHGIEGVGLKNRPTGDPIEVAYAIEAGESWSLEFELDVSVYVETNEGGKIKRNDLEGRMIGSVVQRHRWDETQGRAFGDVEVRFQRIEGNGEVHDTEQAAAAGTFHYAPSGRPERGSLEVEQNSRNEGWKVLHSEYLAGFGGSPSWLPDRAVRVGESWPAETVMDHDALRRILKAHAFPGARLPDLTFDGEVRLERVFQEDGETRLELRIDALVERKGRISHGRSSGRIAMGHRIEGTAVISKRTGLPVRIDVVQTGTTDMKSPQETAEQRSRLTFKARARPGR